MEPILIHLHRLPITDAEKGLGVINIKSTNGILLRNWLTYKLREQVMLLERKAYHSPAAVSNDYFKARLNQSIALEIKQLLLRFKNENKLSSFHELIT